MTELRQRTPRRLNPGYLAWLRKLPCACGCGSPPPSDAAHLRAGSIHYGKRETGKAEKPSDNWALPLLHAHHMAQHDFGDEILWWNRHGKDPFHLALKYNARYTAETGKPAEGPLPAPVSKTTPRSKRAKLARSPGRKAKIANRPSSWPKGRKLRSRGFKK